LASLNHSGYWYCLNDSISEVNGPVISVSLLPVEQLIVNKTAGNTNRMILKKIDFIEICF